MVKLVGYVEMKKKVGKVLFVKLDGSKALIGEATDKIFVFDDLSKKITPESVGHELVVSYACGFNGRAYIADIVVK